MISEQLPHSRGAQPLVRVRARVRVRVTNPNPNPNPNPDPNPNATSLAQDEATLHERGGTLRSVQLAALRLVLFEKQLLAAALRELHDVPAAA